MRISIDESAERTVVEANLNYYAVPFKHPKREMIYHDFIYVLDGEWKIGQNTEEYTLKKDTVLILSAGLCHYGISHCTKGTRTMYFHVTATDGDMIDEEIKNRSIDNFFDASNNSNIKKYFFETVSAKLLGNDKKAELFFKLLICELHENQNNSENIEFGERIKSIIHKTPEKFLSNAVIADMLGVSVKTAENKFKARYGISIHQYMLLFKIEQAISYIKAFPEMTNREIAYDLGFYDEYHLSKQFKKIVGLSPQNYKLTLANNKIATLDEKNESVLCAKGKNKENHIE